jgi:hypothetical protein
LQSAYGNFAGYFAGTVTAHSIGNKVQAFNGDVIVFVAFAYLANVR